MSQAGFTVSTFATLAGDLDAQFDSLHRALSKGSRHAKSVSKHWWTRAELRRWRSRRAQRFARKIARQSAKQ